MRVLMKHLEEMYDELTDGGSGSLLDSGEDEAGISTDEEAGQLKGLVAATGTRDRPARGQQGQEDGAAGSSLEQRRKKTGTSEEPTLVSATKKIARQVANASCSQEPKAGPKAEDDDSEGEGAAEDWA